jgi:hypothetical protein
MDNEKPMELRDQLALQILQAIFCNEASKDFLITYIYHFDDKDTSWAKNVNDRAEERIRAAYKIADIMRKVRLPAFE